MATSSEYRTMKRTDGDEMNEQNTDYGDCFRQAWCYILKCEPSTMPHFVFIIKDNSWFEKFNLWLIENHKCYSINWESRVSFDDLTGALRGCYVAGVIVKETGMHHAIVMCDGEIVFDSKSRDKSEYKYKSMYTLHSYIEPTDLNGQ
jgi:hypothetical protein